MKARWPLCPGLQVLSAKDMIDVYGGGAGPSTNTSFWYDFFYWAARTVRFAGEAVIDAAKNPIRPSTYR